jgi:hypothetical protein
MIIVIGRRRLASVPVHQEEKERKRRARVASARPVAPLSSLA